MALRAPRNLRETFDLLLNLDASSSLPDLAARIDWADVAPRQIYHGVLGRAPESADVAKPKLGYSPKAHFLAALGCSEFQENIILYFLNAFPEKRREIFVHIPKCAGTDLVETLELIYPRLNEHLPRPAETTTEKLISELRRLVARAHCSDSIAVTGHIPLGWFEQRKLLRFGDTIYTVVREPLPLYLSYANFILTRLVQFRGQRRTDTSEWLGYLEMDTIPDNPPKPLLIELASKILRHPAITTRNMICAFLGNGTCETALERIVVHDIEVTEVKRYSEWRRRRWNVDWTIRHNQSLPLVTKSDLGAGDLDFIDSVTREDQKAYGVIMRALEQRDVLSVRGAELV